MLARSICKSIEGKYEPAAELNRLNFLLDARYQEVWEMLLTPAELLQPPEQADGAEEQPEADATKARGHSPGEGAASSDASMPAAEHSDQIESGQAEGQGEPDAEPSAETSVKLDFYQRVLAAIADLMLNEFSVQGPAVS